MNLINRHCIWCPAQSFYANRDELLFRANAVLDEIRAGRLRLRAQHTFPLSEAAEAHRLLEGRHSMAKYCLEIQINIPICTTLILI